MDRSDQPTEFRGAIRNGRSRATAFAAIAVVGLLVGLGWLAGLADTSGPVASPLPSGTAPVAAASPRPSRAPTPRPSFSPTPAPTPVPTLTPVAAPVTTAALSQTGVLVADTGDRSLGGLVPDADGTVWTTRAGAIVNVNPRTGRAREWTLADDPAFGTASIAASLQGGVWLLGPDALRLFDGERFRAVIETPSQAWNVVEAPDGSLWAQTDPYGLIRWKDGAWASDPPGRPGRGASSLVVDDASRVWATSYETSPDGNWIGQGISVWDGQTWTTYGADDLPMISPSEFPSLFASADGSVWAVAGFRLARFVAGRWMTVEVPDLAGKGYPATVDADGRLWFVAEGCETCGVRINVYDGAGWTSYDDATGLPGPEAVGGGWATLLAGPGYVLAATEAGLYRLADGTWRQVEMSGPSGLPRSGSRLPARIGSLAAVSHAEVWAATQPNDPYTGAEIPSGLFRFDGAAWGPERLPVETAVRQLAVAPDGALWVATDAGPMVRRNGVWIDLGATVGKAVPQPADGVPGCGGAISFGDDGLVYYVGVRSANRVIALVPSGSSWSASLHSAPRVSPECPSAMAVDADGTVWLLQRGWGSILSRSAGDPWETIRLPVAGNPSAQADPSAITTDRDGSLWAAAWTYDASTNTGSTDVLELVEDEWVSHGGDTGLENIQELSILSDRSLLAAGNGISRFDGERWHPWLLGVWIERVSVAPDGTVWIYGPNVYRLPTTMP